MKKVSPARLPQQALDGWYFNETGPALPRAKAYLFEGEKTGGTVLLRNLVKQAPQRLRADRGGGIPSDRP